jgi:hypothetical protein
MNTVFAFALLFTVSFSASSEALECFCEYLGPCTSVKILKQTCKGGLVRDNCGCCQVCAKVEDEVCGGLWDEDGYCEQGLFCDIGGKSRYWDMVQGKCQRKTITTPTPPPTPPTTTPPPITTPPTTTPTTTTTPNNISKATKLRVIFEQRFGRAV